MQQLFGGPAPTNGIIYAAQKDRWAAVECFMNSGVDPETRDPETGMTVFIIAAKSGYLSLLQNLDNTRKVDKNAQDKSGNTALTWALTMKNTDLANYLVTISRVKMDTPNNVNDTALIVASRSNQLLVVRSLMARTPPANMDIVNAAGETALIIACHNSYDDVALEILNNGKILPKLDIQSKLYGLSAIMAAAKAGRENLVSALISKGASLNLKGQYGYTALDWAMKNGHTSIVLTLVKYGAKYKIRGNVITSS